MNHTSPRTWRLAPAAPRVRSAAWRRIGALGKVPMLGQVIAGGQSDLARWLASFRSEDAPCDALVFAVTRTDEGA